MAIIVSSWPNCTLVTVWYKSILHRILLTDYLHTERTWECLPDPAQLGTASQHLSLHHSDSNHSFDLRSWLMNTIVLFLYTPISLNYDFGYTTSHVYQGHRQFPKYLIIGSVGGANCLYYKFPSIQYKKLQQANAINE